MCGSDKELRREESLLSHVEGAEQCLRAGVLKGGSSAGNGRNRGELDRPVSLLRKIAVYFFAVLSRRQFA
jgi:hypothetical protein